MHNIQLFIETQVEWDPEYVQNKILSNARCKLE